MINFVLDKSKNYKEVEASLLGAIRLALPEGSWTTSVAKRRAGHLNFSLFIRQPADVVMSHGVADKNYFTDIYDDEGQLYARRLKHVLVPGPWLQRKLLAYPGLAFTANQVHTVGWPRLDLLRRLAAEIPVREPGPRPCVLWAPTHDYTKRGEEQLSTSSYPALDAYLPQLQALFEMKVSLHPRNRDDKHPTELPLLHADAVISDFGTMVYEAWALGKPVVFPRWILGDRIQKYLPGSAEAHIYEQRIGYHPDSFDEMVDILRSGPVVGDDVRTFLREYLGDPEAPPSAERIASLLLRLERRRAQRAAERSAARKPSETEAAGARNGRSESKARRAADADADRHTEVGPDQSCTPALPEPTRS